MLPRPLLTAQEALLVAGAEQCFDRKSCLKMFSRKAESIFWNTPELIENLLRFLDPATIVCLARSHGFTLKILQGSVPWGNLIRRCCPQGDGNSGPDKAVRKGVFHLMVILKTKMTSTDMSVLKRD